MTFEEFFKKKRTDLDALQKAEPLLYAEFKAHYQEMGEKSFDHTKKYWFNGIRRRFPLAAEVKTDKIHLENALAEQTIVETLTETPKPAISEKVGFKPRFKAAAIKAQPPASSDQQHPVQKDDATSTPEVNEAAETGDQFPPFQQEKEAMQNMADHTERRVEEAPSTERAGEQPQTKTSYVPRFKMKPKADAEQTAPPAEEPPVPLPENTAPKPAYKPRFNMKNIKPPSPEE